MAEWSHRYARINGIRMHYVEQGAGIPVVLCHGFPHLWFSWRHQLPVIAQAGFRAVAPDMRGMGQSDAPAEVAATDIKALLEPFNLTRELSSNRTQGVPNMIALIRDTAARLAAA